MSPPITTPPQHQFFEDKDSLRQHAFKIVTTKRTLLLCAPSEEEEIRWLSAIGALIARRTDAGVVPGEPTEVSPSSSAMSPGGGGIRSKVRRTSVSGMSAFLGSSASPGAVEARS